jgi:hypothetical protein
VAFGCGHLAQSDECKQYVACTEAIDPTTWHAANGLYGPNGTCWNTNQATADACTTVCAELTDELYNDGGMDTPECQPPDAGP